MSKDLDLFLKCWSKVIREELMKTRFEYVEPRYLVGDYPPSIPRRSTLHSAGYDFFLPSDIDLQPGSSVEIKSNIKCYLEDDQELHLRLRSSVAKRGVILLMDTIDADYVDNKKNDGNISIKLYLLPGFEPLKFRRGDKVVQGVIHKFEKLEEEYCDNTVRVGGIGSTGV